MKVRFQYCAATFGLSLLLAVASSYPVQATPSKAEIDNYAKAHGFENSDYPYYERTNRCGGEGWSGTAVRDSWGKVSFGDACDNHDRCYMTLGSDVNACNDNFYKELRASCERDSYFRDPIFHRKVPDPATLSACYPIATSYYSAVVAVGLNWWTGAQTKAALYNNMVQAFIAPQVDYAERTRQLYRSILDREPDPSGFSDNVNAMRQHGFEWVRAGMAGSQESRNNINNLYRQYLCRDADSGGMDFHINLLASGQMALDQIRNGIANGAEAQQHKNGCR